MQPRPPRHLLHARERPPLRRQRPRHQPRPPLALVAGETAASIHSVTLVTSFNTRWPPSAPWCPWPPSSSPPSCQSRQYSGQLVPGGYRGSYPSPANAHELISIMKYIQEVQAIISYTEEVPAIINAVCTESDWRQAEIWGVCAKQLKRVSDCIHTSGTQPQNISS